MKSTRRLRSAPFSTCCNLALELVQAIEVPMRQRLVLEMLLLPLRQKAETFLHVQMHVHPRAVNATEMF